MNADDSDDQGVVMKTTSNDNNKDNHDEKNESTLNMNDDDHHDHHQNQHQSSQKHSHHQHHILQFNNLNQDDMEIAVFSELSHLCPTKDGQAWREIARFVSGICIFFCFV